MYKLEKTEYYINNKNFTKSIKIALLSDLHSNEARTISSVTDILKSEAPNYILCAGDIFERLDGSYPEQKEKGFELLAQARDVAPTFFSVGNHENGGIRSWNKLKWSRIKSIPKYYDAAELKRIADIGIIFLDDCYTMMDGIAFGGLSSGLINEGRKPKLQWLDEFCAFDGPKLLLCHHPEYYKKYLYDKNIDLTVSGHAHGGQWRIFGRGIFAPGQGIFPKYTSGLHDGRLVISRGLKPSEHIPRIFNTPEVVIVNVNQVQKDY